LPPEKGWKSISLRDETIKKLSEALEELNKRSKYRKYRSVAHLVEQATDHYIAEEFRALSEDPEELIRHVASLINTMDKERLDNLLRNTEHLSQEDLEQAIDIVLKNPKFSDEMAKRIAARIAPKVEKKKRRKPE